MRLREHRLLWRRSDDAFRTRAIRGRRARRRSRRRRDCEPRLREPRGGRRDPRRRDRARSRFRWWHRRASLLEAGRSLGHRLWARHDGRDACARTTKRREGASTNVHFLKGLIEAIPLPAETVDVVISNCVVNLSTDKRAVLAEIVRVLRPGRTGRDHGHRRRRSSSRRPTARSVEATSAASRARFRAEYREGLTGCGLVDVEVEFTHRVADGMHGAIVRAPTSV